MNPSSASNNKRKALGRGLGALIPGSRPFGSVLAPFVADPGPHAVATSNAAPTPASAAAAAIAPVGPPATRDYFVCAIEDIHPSPEQPRRHFDEQKLGELAQSIREAGVLQPLVVRQRPSVDGTGFWLIAGERRWRAAQRAGLHQVPVVVRDVTADAAFELALIENVQRDDLNAIEEAEAYQQLLDRTGETQEALAQRIGKDRSTVTNTLRLLKLPIDVRGFVLEGRLSMGHARALLGLDDATQVSRMAKQVIDRGLSVRDTEELVRKTKAPPVPGKTALPAKTTFVRDLEERLTRTFGAQIAVKDKGQGKGGHIEIPYSDLDQLDRILDRLLP